MPWECSGSAPLLTEPASSPKRSPRSASRFPSSTCSGRRSRASVAVVLAVAVVVAVAVAVVVAVAVAVAVAVVIAFAVAVPSHVVIPKDAPHLLRRGTSLRFPLSQVAVVVAVAVAVAVAVPSVHPERGAAPAPTRDLSSISTFPGNQKFT
jgi:hypothetical protein